MDTSFGLRHNFFALLNLKLITVFSVLPLSVKTHTDLIGTGQFVSHRHKTDQVVAVLICTSGLLGDTLVGGFHTDDTVFAGRIIEDRPVVFCGPD